MLKLTFSIFSKCSIRSSGLFGFLMLAVGLISPVSSLTASTIIDVPAGDSDGLLAAISDANQSSEETIIRLNSGADYLLNLSVNAPEPISGHIILLGDGSRLVGEGAESYGRLFDVLEQGTLEVSDLVIRNFETDEARGDGFIVNDGTLIGHDLLIENLRSNTNVLYTNAVFENSDNGQLHLNRVRIGNVTINTTESTAVIAIANKGDAFLQNLLVVDGRGYRLGSNNSPIGSYIYNINFGKLEITNSTLVLESKNPAITSQVQAISRSAVRPCCHVAGLKVIASMIFGFECPFKQSDVSGGFNIVSADACPFSQPTDRLGVSAQALQFRLHTDGGLKVVLPAYSPAVDLVSSADIECNGQDAIGAIRPVDGNHDGVTRCDSGAFEYSGGDSLHFGGENGLYYSAGADGHYVTIQEVRPQEYVVLWNTFDQDGNEAWILGVGTRTNDLITAQAEYQTEGRLIPGGGADVDTTQRINWGIIEIQLSDCLQGTFRYQSVLPQFGSGSFSLDRLGYLSGIDCKD